MSKLRLPASTEEYLSFRVRLDDDRTDPTSYAVDFALLPRGQAPVSGDFSPAEWITASPPYKARGLVTGQTAGDYALWVRVSADPENPVRPAAVIQFY